MAKAVDTVKRSIRNVSVRFNLVEVVLGMGLIAFGLVSTIGLFPVGLTANRDAIAESLAADGADQFLHLLAARLKDPANSFQNWTDFGLSLPTYKPGPYEPSATAWTVWMTEPANPNPSDAWTTRYWYGGSTKEYYRMEQKVAASASVESSAIYRVWRDTVMYPQYVAGVWTQVAADPDRALVLNLEVSWPSTLPYERRHKSLYQLEVFKPQTSATAPGPT